MADQTKTAPVDEYRVMWTTNKTQKIKKWHDGFLRYHSFNRRMLVYDDGRHLVADMYLRDREFLGEGDELEFEHHLVSIEDFHGSVNQDLTPIFSPALQRKHAAATAASTVQTPTPNRRREPGGALRGGTTGAQSARQQRPAARGPFTPTTVQGENRDGLGNGHMTAPSRPAQAPATVPRMNEQGRRNGVTNLNTPGRQDNPPVAGPRRSGQLNGHTGMDTPGPQARASIPAYRGNRQATGNMNINTPVRNSHPTRQHVAYAPQASEPPINFGRAGSPISQQAPPTAPPQPIPHRQNHNTRPEGRTPPLVIEAVHASAQLSTRHPPPSQRPQHQQRNEVPERGRPVTAGHQIPAQVNKSGNVTRISPPMPQGRPVSRANQNHPVPQQSEPPAQQRYSPPAPRPGSRPVPAPPPALAQAPPDEPAFTAPATINKIRQFSAPSRARPPRQPTAPPPPPQRCPEPIQVPSSAAEHPPHISRSPSPRNRPPPPLPPQRQQRQSPPLLQNQTSIPSSRSPSPTHNPINRPPKRPPTVNDANQPPTKRKTQFKSARRFAEQGEQDEIHDVDDSDDDNMAGPTRQGAGVIKLSSTSGPKKKMLLCARPPTFKFPPKRLENGGNGDGNENREKPKTVADEEDYGWDEDDEIMSLY